MQVLQPEFTVVGGVDVPAGKWPTQLGNASGSGDCVVLYGQHNWAVEVVVVIVLYCMANTIGQWKW